MSQDAPESLLETLAAKTRQRAARMESIPPGDWPPKPGDVVLLPLTADLPVEWALLRRDAGRLLVVPADTNPLAGSADVELPEDSPMAPLTLRCGFGTWIEEARLASARRTGALSTEEVSEARQVWEARERGERVGSLLGEEVDADPEYRDWVEDVLVPARSALATPAAAPVIPMRRRPSFFGNPYALAASVLLMVTVGLTGGLLWQDRRIEEEQARVEEALRQEREKLAGELRNAEERHRHELAERDRQAAAVQQRAQERIAELERRLNETGRPELLLNVPFVGLAPRDPVRGEIEEVILPPGADLFFLLLSVTDTRPFPSYRLEVVSKETSRGIWKGEGLKASPLNEVSLALPRDVLPPGDYRLRLLGLKDGKAELVGEYELRIAHH